MPEDTEKINNKELGQEKEVSPEVVTPEMPEGEKRREEAVEVPEV